LDFNLSARRNFYPHHFGHGGDMVWGIEEVFYCLIEPQVKTGRLYHA